MMIFKKLDEKTTKEYKEWARCFYVPFTPIQGVWHPIVQQECVDINRENSLEE